MVPSSGLRDLTMDAVVMAGGRGTRLQPLTFSLPKPLLPVGERPIVEILVRQLASQGFRRVFLSIGHKGHLIRAYFNGASVPGTELVFIEEPEPLGTAGALRLLPSDVEHVFVVNGDILADVDFAAVLSGHVGSGFPVTVVVNHHPVPLPYGVFTLDGDAVMEIREKPTLQLPVATGMYALSRAAIDELPSGRTDMPDLLNRLAVRRQVRAHVIEGFWTDVADLAAYEAVNLDAQRWADL